MLNWSKQFSIILYLDSNNHQTPYSRYECLLGAGIHQEFITPSLDQLHDFHGDNKDWLFGHICYDHKNTLEQRLTTTNKTYIDFPELSFFVPQIVCYIPTGNHQLVIETLVEEPDTIYNSIVSAVNDIAKSLSKISFAQRTTQNHYLETVDKLRAHIREGDCYEINYCNEYYAEAADINPYAAFCVLNNLSKAPFSAFYKYNDKYLICASPERYLQKSGGQITAQPIKGTAGRGVSPETDAAAKEALSNSIKEKAENVMITDLVRNDLARSCITGSVHVDELYGIYSFPQVHQMISTVSATLDEHTPFTDAIKYSFPIGSMTGAPKIKVMELIDKYEDAGRGLFSGSVGYMTPSADFDFNVIIRSLFYDAALRRLSYQAGGAITYDSSPKAEWDEMRLKAKALEAIFSN